MSAPLSLAQRLLLVKFLTDTLGKLRKDELLPQSAGEMPAGSRLPVMFGGRHAGWALMPAASTSVTVTDEKKLLAWAEQNYPAKVRTAETVKVDDDLIAFLAEHYPSALEKRRQVEPAWVGDITTSLKEHGYHITMTGEKLTDVPGITVSESSPAPRVNLTPDAAEIIGNAWRDGDIPMAELLALPAAAGGEGQ